MGDLCIVGASSGGGGKQQAPRTPVEAADSLRSVATARVLMLMGLGQFAGPDGELLQSIYLDGVPLKSADGALNFERVSAEWRGGSQDQSRIAGFGEVETEYGVGVEVKTTTPATRQIDDLDADAVRVTVSVPALVAADAGSGDTNPTTVELAVDIKPAVGAWAVARVITIGGKTRSKYQRSVRIPLTGSGPWQLRVRRITADSGTQNLQNATAWDSYTVINEAPLRYPNYALLALRFDAKAFSSFPKIEVRWRLAVLQVPSNYDPATRRYSGPWDGTFKPAWSDNPAWWLWTYATDKRYNVNVPPGAWKWDLYRIAQWCDQLVSDGQGGTRPRFTCHMIQSESVDAWKVLQDIASVFCGRVIPFAGGVRVMADIPGEQPAKHFMPANVKDGRFTYSSTELADRHTVAVVSFVDPDDSDKRATEYVEHADGLALYGYQPAEVAAVGCTNRAQAQQLGRYILETAQSETEMVSFATGAYGMDLMPGELFHVTHPTVAGGRFGGRLLAVEGVRVTLDAPVTLAAGVGYSLEVPMPDGTLLRRGVSNGVGSTDSIVLAAPFPAQPVEGTTWLLVATNVAPTLWRCVRNAESKDHPGERDISGVQHDPHKWQRIEQGIRIDPPPVSLLPDPGRINAVSVVEAREVSTLRPDGARAVRLDIDWPALSHPYLRGYVVGIRQAGGDWRELPEQAANHAEIPDIMPGAWQLRVAAVSVTGLRSAPTVADMQARGHAAPPPRPAFTAVGGAGRVDFTITWPAPDCVRAELYGSARADDPNPARLADLAYPATTWTQLGVSTGTTLHYWLRVVDSWGNVSPFATASATAIQDPTILLQQLHGKVSREALDGLLRTELTRLDDIAGRVLPQINAANQQAAEAALKLLVEADQRVAEARFNRRVFDAIIDVDPVNGQIKLKATAAITTDVDAKLRDVQLRIDALNGSVASTVSAVDKHGGRLTAAETTLQQLQDSITLSVQQAYAYTDAAVSSNAAAVGDLQRQTRQLGEAQLRALLEAERQAGIARAGRIGLAQAKLEIKANAEELAAEGRARLELAARLGTTEASLLDEQRARADGHAALSQRLQQLGAAVAGKAEGSAVSALNQRLDNAEASLGGKASANSVQTLQSTVGEHSTTLQQQAASLNGVLGQWSLKVTTTSGGQQRVAGISLLNGEQGSAFAVLADQFQVALPDGSGAKQVFSVGRIGGLPSVGIDGALVVDNTITARALQVDRLSALAANLGVMTAGRAQNASGSNVIDFDAAGSQPFLRVGGGITLRADGSGEIGGDLTVGGRFRNNSLVRSGFLQDRATISSGGSWSIPGTYDRTLSGFFQPGAHYVFLVLQCQLWGSGTSASLTSQLFCNGQLLGTASASVGADSASDWITVAPLGNGGMLTAGSGDVLQKLSGSGHSNYGGSRAGSRWRIVAMRMESNNWPGGWGTDLWQA